MKRHEQMSKAELVDRVKRLEATLAAARLSSEDGLATDTTTSQHNPADSEERLRAILQTAVEGIITIDEQGIVESMNPAAERIFGYQAAEIAGRNVSLLMPSPDRDQHDHYIRAYCRSGEAKIIGVGREVVGQRKDGSVFPMDLAVSEVRLASQRLFTGFVRDITERKRAELAQRIQHATTRALAESDTLAEAAPKILRGMVEGLDWSLGELWTVDAEAGVLRCVETWHPPSVDVSELELRTREMSLTPGTGMPGTTWASAKATWIDDVDHAVNFPRAALAAKAGLHGAFAFPIVMGQQVLGVMMFLSREAGHMDAGLLEVFDSIGNQIGQFAERKKAEAALKRENAFISAVLETTSALVVILDRKGRIVRFNRAAEITTGYSFAEVAGHECWSLFLFPEEMKEVKSVFESLRSGTFPLNHENYWRTKDGQRRLIAWSNNVLCDQNQAVEYVIATGIDITERKRLEREILEISDREQRRIGQDLHDGLGQHLAGIELMSQVLEQKLVKRAKPVAARAANIARLVRQAISQTRQLARGLSPVVLESEGLMSALQELATQSEEMFRIQCRFDCEQPVLVHDHAVATHLFRIAQEAVSNAVKHGQASCIVIRLMTSGERTVLMVRDDGVGLPRTLSKTRGMGLHIMQYRAGVIGGSLAVQREPEGGTSVVCSIQSQPQPKS